MSSIEAPPGFDPKNEGFFKDLDLRGFTVFKERKQLEDVGGGKAGQDAYWAAWAEGCKRDAMRDAGSRK